MGVLNVTPDSFSDGGHYHDPAIALRQARQMIEEGADIIDIGGESTRPGAQPVHEEEELARIIPVVEALARDPRAIISVDTRKAAVAGEALKKGAHIINDVSGLADPAMARVVAQQGAGLVIMHMQGEPAHMQDAPQYADVVGEITSFLCDRIRIAVDSGMNAGCIVVDPGIGFGKNLEHNLALLRTIPELERVCGRPVLVGVSRKRMIGAITGREIPDRLAGSLAAATYALMNGARIIRVHDVKESCDAARVIDRLQNIQGA